MNKNDILQQSQMNTSMRNLHSKNDQRYKKSFDKREYDRKTEIKFPDDCTIGQKVNLHIQSLNLNFSPSSDSKKFTTVVDVEITAPSFKTQKQREQLIFSPGENSNEISFTLIPIEKGEQVIEVEFFLEASRVGYVIIQSEVR